MRQAIAAGGAYFGVVFAVGFVLGAGRTFILAPTLGELAAVAVELPVILAVSWLACRRLARMFGVPPRLPPRLVMGATAFMLLMAGEAGVSIGFAGRDLAQHLSLYRQAPHLLGLAGQLAFALMPAAQARPSRPGAR